MSRPSSVAVTWMSSGFFAARALRRSPRRPDRAGHRRRQHRAGIDRRRWYGRATRRSRLRECPWCRAAHATPRGGGLRHARRSGRATGASMRGLRQRRDDEIAFPGAIGRLRPMLDGAAAADAEMRTERRDALGRAASSTRSRCRRSGWPGTRFGLDRLARQRVGNKDVGPSGVSAMPSPRWPTRAMTSRSLTTSSCRTLRRTRLQVGMLLAVTASGR